MPVGRNKWHLKEPRKKKRKLTGHEVRRVDEVPQFIPSSSRTTDAKYLQAHYTDKLPEGVSENVRGLFFFLLLISQQNEINQMSDSLGTAWIKEKARQVALIVSRFPCSLDGFAYMLLISTADKHRDYLLRAIIIFLEGLSTIRNASRDQLFMRLFEKPRWDSNIESEYRQKLSETQEKLRNRERKQAEAKRERLAKAKEERRIKQEQERLAKVEEERRIKQEQERRAKEQQEREAKEKESLKKFAEEQKKVDSNLRAGMSLSELKKQYHRLCLELHPDKATGTTMGFQYLLQRYEELKN